MNFLKKTIIFLIIFLVLIFTKGFSLAQSSPTPTPTTSPANQDLQNKISEYTSKINELKSQANTLSSQIAVMDNQIKLTEYQIASTQEQITDITLDIDTTTKKISGLERSLNELVEVLLNRMVATYEVGTIQPLQILLTSSDASDFFSRLNYLKRAQAHDKQLIYQTQQAKVDYANQKEIFEDEKKKVESLKIQLEEYDNKLEQDKQAKQRLLTETQGSEANYQRLLAQAKAQLAGFQRFVTSQGGASILSGQTYCDDWGCYYNQRDSQWGNNSLNGTQYTLASDGCLVTAMAMVYTHLGKKGVTPQTINSNSSNFASYYPAYLNKRISADGMTLERVYATIDGELSAGRPVIIGIGRGPDHFVVFVSGSNGDYTMYDPFVPNGHHIKFTDHYSVSNINSIEKIEIK
ncbi:MAG: hypothetical protein HY344_02600 [Candidatus Levybacteria bacterium]|nr:hypothetical protein [Candidatus Levybacteria bacterium]